jgi:hypothetical protein
MSRCTATVQNGWTVVFRSTDDTSRQCLRPSVRTYTDGSGYCAQHLKPVLQHHHYAVYRILSIPPRDI